MQICTFCLMGTVKKSRRQEPGLLNPSLNIDRGLDHSAIDTLILVFENLFVFELSVTMFTFTTFSSPILFLRNMFGNNCLHRLYKCEPVHSHEIICAWIKTLYQLRTGGLQYSFTTTFVICWPSHKILFKQVVQTILEKRLSTVLFT